MPRKLIAPELPAGEQEPIRKPTYNLAAKLKLRKAFVTGEGALDRLAEREKISFWTARSWFRRERWDLLKQKYDNKQVTKILRIENDFLKNEKFSDECPPDACELTAIQLEQVNQALLDSDDANDILRLAKAKETLENVLWVQRHGARPGTQRPARVPTRRQSAPTFDPAPVQPTPIDSTPSTPQAIVDEDLGELNSPQ